MITTVVPGTVWSELALDRSVLLLHVFDLEDEAASSNTSNTPMNAR